MIKFDDVLARFESATCIERYTGVCQILVTIEHTLGAEDRATVYAYLEEWFREACGGHRPNGYRTVHYRHRCSVRCEQSRPRKYALVRNGS